MDRTAGQISTSKGSLYPMTAAFDSRMIDRGDGHQLYVEQSGRPDGQPVVVLHGGPGGGCSPFMRRFFDPRHYRVILFDQRGCGRSRPIASTENNTTAHLIGDIEAIRQELDIERWACFGGSWGATLALAYAQTHPDRVCNLILRGVFLARQKELDWFYGGGAAMFFPDRWQNFLAPIPPEEHADLIGAYHRRLFSGNWQQEAMVAQHWIGWENALAGLTVIPPGPVPSDYARTFARLECHYFANHCFLRENQLLEDRARIEHIPTVVVQGRYDMICPPCAAWDLVQGWRQADLRLVPAAGHALSERAIADELVGVMDGLRRN